MRGPVSHHVIVRLADEGVPVGAIARAVQKPAADLWPILRDAVHAGQLAMLPAPDWPPGSRRIDRKPMTLPTCDLEATAMPLQRIFALTAAEARAFAVLVRRAEAATPTLHVAISGDRPSIPKTVDVTICKLRKKLKPFGVAIETIFGRGYALRPAMRRRVEQILDADARGESFFQLRQSFCADPAMEAAHA